MLERPNGNAAVPIERPEWEKTVISEPWEETVESDGLAMPGHLFDGYMLHQLALSHKLRIFLLPRQVALMGVNTAIPADISFTHGVPQSSTLSAVTFAQDRRLRRALFERWGVAKPRGASFSHRSLARAKTWAKETGFPVSVKEAIGENDGRAVRHIRTAGELGEAFTDLRVRREEDRAPGSNPRISGYTTTRLTYIVDDQGRELAPPRTRMLVEHEPAGAHYRAYVVAGRIAAVLAMDNSTMRATAEVTEAVSPGLRDAARKAAEAIPGLGCAVVDIVEVKGRNPFRKPRFVVTELSERPRMAQLASSLPETARRIAGSLLESEAERAGVDLPSPSAHIKRRIRIDGLKEADESSRALTQAYKALGASLELESVDDVTGSLVGKCEGATATVAALNEMLMSGDLIGDRASAIEYLEEY